MFYMAVKRLPCVSCDKYLCVCVTVLIVGQGSSPARPPHNGTETGPPEHSEHPLQTQSETRAHVQTHTHTHCETISGEMVPSTGYIVKYFRLGESLMMPLGKHSR